MLRGSAEEGIGDVGGSEVLNGHGNPNRPKTACAAVSPHMLIEAACSRLRCEGTCQTRSHGIVTYSAKAPGRSLVEHA